MTIKSNEWAVGYSKNQYQEHRKDCSNANKKRSRQCNLLISLVSALGSGQVGLLYVLVKL